MPYSNGLCKPLSIIRDTELEEYTLSHVHRLFEMAGLNQQSARVVFIQDDSINAFVVAGTTIFIHTGLIVQSENRDAFLGVLAHEIGHIVGGHSARLYDHYQRAQTTALITTILGGIAAVASGRGDVGMAVMAGGIGTTSNYISTYRMSEENTADSTSVALMKKAGYSPAGLLTIIKKIQMQERLMVDRSEAYGRTHPLTSSRVNFLSHAAQNAPPPANDEAFTLIKAKLFGFLYLPHETLNKYTGNTLPDRYAQAIAFFKMTQIERALSLTETLIQEQPNNAYFWELKGQILFESGRVADAVAAYEQAVLLDPTAVLIQLAYAHALIESGQPAKAIAPLEYIAPRDTLLPETWRLLSVAYGQTNQQGKALYAMTEYALLTGDLKTAQRTAERAEKLLKNDTAKSLRLSDIKDDIAHRLSEQ